MDLSPKISLMRLFIAGSSKAHPLPETHLNDPGPFTSSARKSSMS